MLKRGHLIQDTAQRPNVRLVVVRLVLEQFWTHIVRRPDTRLCKLHRALENLGDSKITNSDVTHTK